MRPIAHECKDASADNLLLEFAIQVLYHVAMLSAACSPQRVTSWQIHAAVAAAQHEFVHSKAVLQTQAIAKPRVHASHAFGEAIQPVDIRCTTGSPSCWYDTISQTVAHHTRNCSRQSHEKGAPGSTKTKLGAFFKPHHLLPLYSCVLQKGGS